MHKPCVVVVDRDPIFLELIDLLLDANGYSTIGCRSARTAQPLIREAQPALVLIDVRNGGDDPNWLVIDMLRLDPTTAQLPIIVCSIDAEYLREKADYFELLGITSIAKPFRTVDLLCRLEREIRPSVPHRPPPVLARAAGGYR